MIFTKRTTTTIASEPIDFGKLKIIEPSSKECFRGFVCGEREIDKWAAKNAYKFHESRRARVFIAVEEGGSSALGFYVLSATNEAIGVLENQSDRDYYYRMGGAPFMYISYLAVRAHRQRCGIGTMLLGNALTRCYRVAKNIPFCGVALRPISDDVAKIYEKYGFKVVSGDDSRHPLMIISIWSLIDLVGDNE